jgi:uncharacterized damage-inducible protein DinB
MTALAQLCTLFEYNEWANAHVLDAASHLDTDDFARDLGASFGSVQGNLSHMLFAQRLWLSRWTGGTAPPPVGQMERTAISRELAAADAALRTYIQALPETELEREWYYVDTQGNAQRAVLWHTLLHVANHGTHHRAEAAMLLTALGRPPRQLDLAFFTLEKAGAPPRLT